MAEPLFDDGARAMRRVRALSRAARPFLAERIVADLAERLALVQRGFGRALVTGCPPALEEPLRGVAASVRFAPSLDALAETEEGVLDLLLVVGELDVRDELPVLLRIARSRLAPGGLCLGALPGGHSLPALRTALHAAGAASGGHWPRVHPAVEAGAFAGLLGAAGFTDPVVDVDRLDITYRSFAALVSDLRDHAATNLLAARRRSGMRRAALRAAEEAFAALGEGGPTREQVELLHFAAWA